MGGEAWLGWLLFTAGFVLLAWLTLRLGRKRRKGPRLRIVASEAMPRDCIYLGELENGMLIKNLEHFEVTESHMEDGIEVIDGMRLVRDKEPGDGD